MPRYVLLYHDCPPGYVRPSHWDLMLDDGGAMATWALRALPRVWFDAYERTTQRFPHCRPASESVSVPAERLANHRLDFLDFEGPLSGNRGNVTRVAAGVYEPLARSDENWEIDVADGLPPGKITLQRVSAADSQAWVLSCGD